MKILKIEPGKPPEPMEIDGSLASMQALVGGTIQAVYLFEEPVAIVCNDEGKLLGLPPNRTLRHPNTGEAYDILCGTVFLCGAPPEEETFTSLSDAQMERYRQAFFCPEMFCITPAGLMILRMEEPHDESNSDL